MSGHIIEQYGWKYAFYVVSVIFAIFVVLWFFVVYDSPSEHPMITEAEKEFIASKVSPTFNSKKVVFMSTSPIFEAIDLIENKILDMATTSINVFIVTILGAANIRCW